MIYEERLKELLLNNPMKLRQIRRLLGIALLKQSAELDKTISKLKNEGKIFKTDKWWFIPAKKIRTRRR